MTKRSLHRQLERARTAKAIKHEQSKIKHFIYLEHSEGKIAQIEREDNKYPPLITAEDNFYLHIVGTPIYRLANPILVINGKVEWIALN